MDKKTFPYEQAAEFKTVTTEAWVCKSCGRGYPHERTARWCCAMDLPCETEGCTGRSLKPYLYCKGCLDVRELNAWLALPEEPWDGETPLCVYRDDKYFFSVDDLDDYIADQLEEGTCLEDIRLVICKPAKKPFFSISEFLCDYLSEDDEVDDAEEIDKIVNDWIENRIPNAWEAGKTRPTLASLKEETKFIEG